MTRLLRIRDNGSEHMADNRFNMNVNEAQIKIQHRMEEIKSGGGVFPASCEGGGSSSRTLDAARRVFNFLKPLFCRLHSWRRNPGQTTQRLFADDVALLFLFSDEDGSGLRLV